MSLRVVPPETLPGGISMAVDSILAREMARDSEPVCRFYRWSGPTVTVGRRIPAAGALAAAAAYSGARLFRRPTGGGVVFHGDQPSFSVIWPRGLQALRGLRESYAALHLVLSDSLAACGVECVQAVSAAAERGVFCASSVECGDLTDNTGRKIAGGAQWRAAHAVLYQGHLWLPALRGIEQAFAERLAEFLGTKAADWPLPEDVRALAHAEQRLWEIPPAPRTS